MKSILVISHGSRSPKTKQEVEILVQSLKMRSQIDICEYAFLELEEPDIPTGIDNCVSQGATEVIVLLNFLNSGKHVDEDIPQIIENAREKYPNVSIQISKPVGQHEDIVSLFLTMI